jgi:hypothetical protein
LRLTQTAEYLDDGRIIGAGSYSSGCAGTPLFQFARPARDARDFGDSGARAFNNPVVDRKFFASVDVSHSEINAAWIGGCINLDTRRVAVIYEPIVIAAKNESITARINVPVVQHGCAEVGRMLFECAWIEV